MSLDPMFCFILLSFSWLARTDPRDVARVESKTVIVTQEQRDTVPSPRAGGISQLGRWMSQEELDKAMDLRFPGCMKGSLKSTGMFCCITGTLTQNNVKTESSIIFSCIYMLMVFIFLGAYLYDDYLYLFIFTQCFTRRTYTSCTCTMCPKITSVHSSLF